MDMSNEEFVPEPKNKRLSVERIYQKKTQLEHILLRPDTYVGSIEEVTQKMWVYDEGADAIVYKPITFVPGLYKIFDEILGKLKFWDVVSLFIACSNTLTNLIFVASYLIIFVCGIFISQCCR